MNTQATESRVCLPDSLSTRNPKLEAPDRLEHWPLNASRSLGSIIKDAAAADRKALSNQASAPLKHLELWTSGSIDSATRDPLAVLLLSTDILREYGGRLSSSVLKEQLEAMHVAALELSSAMGNESSDGRPFVE